MGIFDVWIGWFLLFLSLHIAVSLPLSFCSRRYMVWKKLDEKLQDGCLEHGSLWCVNGVILAISESPWCQKLSIKFLHKRIYGLEDVEEFQYGCEVHDHLVYLSGMKESFLILLLALRIQSGSCSWGHMVWRKMLFEEYQECCSVLDNLWYLNKMILFILSLHVVRFQLKRT